MSYSTNCRERGVRLEVHWYKPRKCWRKRVKGHTPFYFQHPDTKQGYEAALREWILAKAKIDGERPHADIWHHHRALFQIVETYWEQFGKERSEATLAKEVRAFLESIDSHLVQPELHGRIGIGGLGKQFRNEFVGTEFSDFGTIQYKLPQKWQERIDRLNEKEHKKRPQTIKYWLERYLTRQDERSGKQITRDTAKSKHHKLSYFIRMCDRGSHITSIDGRHLKDFHIEVDGLKLAKRTKEDYFDAYKSFLTWCHEDEDCDFTKPVNFNSSEFTFREPEGTGRKRLKKKTLLWTTEEVVRAINDLPAPYNCYVLLMLNCGFRHQDLSQLQHFDLHLVDKRIIIQREKLNQKDTAPVIAYPLWDKTIDMIQDNISDNPKFVFVNERGGQVRNSLKSWWKRNKEHYGLGHKRLDFLRKTGSTIVAKHNKDMDEFYLGESLKTTSRIHYSFTDGEPMKELDDAIMMMGSRFGFAEPPHKTITLTPDMLAKLEAAGIEV